MFNNTASVAESYIGIVKRKLYMLLRGTLDRNWPSQLQNVVKSLNNTPIQRLGWLKPNEIQSEEDSVTVDKAKLQSGVTLQKEPTYSEQNFNKKDYEGSIQLNSYVYKSFDVKIFDKSFDVSVSGC